MNRFLCALIGMSFLACPAQARCGDDPNSCTMSDGEYHLVLPDFGARKPAVVMFLHGAGGSGITVMKNKRLINSFLARGYGVLAPTAQRSFGKGSGFVWNFFPGWEGRNENQFLQDVAGDASRRFGFDRGRILLAGFSAGGFMVNYLACDTPDAFAAYASVSGGFWRPHPDRCAGPVKLLHTHGWTDRTVPLEGRSLGGGQYQQGDIFAGLEIWREANDCAGENPDSHPDSHGGTGEFWRRKWTECVADSALELAIFPGGHRVPAGWSDMVLDWFEAEVPE